MSLFLFDKYICIIFLDSTYKWIIWYLSFFVWTTGNVDEFVSSNSQWNSNDHQSFSNPVGINSSLIPDAGKKALMLGKTEGRRRRGWLKMRWLDGIADSMDMSFSKVWEMLRQESLECCSPRGWKESDMTEWLNWKERSSSLRPIDSIEWRTGVSGIHRVDSTYRYKAADLWEANRGKEV